MLNHARRPAFPLCMSIDEALSQTVIILRSDECVHLDPASIFAPPLPILRSTANTASRSTPKPAATIYQRRSSTAEHSGRRAINMETHIKPSWNWISYYLNSISALKLMACRSPIRSHFTQQTLLHTTHQVCISIHTCCSVFPESRLLFSSWQMRLLRERIANGAVVMIKGTKTSTAVSLILRCANDYMVDEMDRAVHDALSID